MSDLFWLTTAQMRRIGPYFPLSQRISRVDDRKVISGIIFVIRNGLRWRDAPKDYGPHKTIYYRFIRWSRLGVFNNIFAALAANVHDGGRLNEPFRQMTAGTMRKASSGRRGGLCRPNQETRLHRAAKQRVQA
jgi:transposase